MSREILEIILPNPLFWFYTITIIDNIFCSVVRLYICHKT